MKVVGGSFYVLENGVLQCTGFCESAEIMAECFRETAPFDATGLKSTFFEDWDDEQVDAVASHPSPEYRWVRGVWSSGGRDRETIAAVREMDL